MAKGEPKEFTPLILRIKELCKDLDITERAFSLSIGKSSGYLSNPGQSITTKVMNNILFKYPKVNMNWVLTGTGSKFIQDTSQFELTEQALSILRDQLKIKDQQIEALHSYLKGGIAHPDDTAKCVDVAE